MKGKKEYKEAKEDKLNMEENLTDNNVCEEAKCSCEADATDDKLTKELESLKGELDEKNKKLDDYLDRLQRAAAEFDNYKKRTVREKESLYSEAVSDVISAILPAIDSIERALQICPADSGSQSLKDGIELIYRQMKDSLKNIGVEEINCCEACFDPQLHNAVMHVEDEACGQNIIVEEFQKGYIYKDKIIRHSIVKVAN